MTDSTLPPPSHIDVRGEHWLVHRGRRSRAIWTPDDDSWEIWPWKHSAELMHAAGWRYDRPVAEGE
jgi:hypothetical protein